MDYSLLASTEIMLMRNFKKQIAGYETPLDRAKGRNKAMTHFRDV